MKNLQNKWWKGYPSTFYPFFIRNSHRTVWWWCGLINIFAAKRRRFSRMFIFCLLLGWYAFLNLHFDLSFRSIFSVYTYLYLYIYLYLFINFFNWRFESSSMVSNYEDPPLPMLSSGNSIWEFSWKKVIWIWFFKQNYDFSKEMLLLDIHHQVHHIICRKVILKIFRLNIGLYRWWAFFSAIFWIKLD